MNRRKPSGEWDPLRARVFAAIATSRDLALEELPKRTGIPQDALRGAVESLIDRRYIIARPHGALTRTSQLSVAGGPAYVIGIRIRPPRVIGIATNLRCDVLEDSTQRELRAERVFPPDEQTPDAVITTVALVVEDLRKRMVFRAEQPGSAHGEPMGRRTYSSEQDALHGIGVELGGHIDPRSGLVRYSPNLEWHDVRLGAKLKTALEFENVVVENDVNALAVAEQWFGIGQGFDSFVVILLDEGVGCGIVLNNELIYGASGIAGEFGHIVIEPNGRRCRCKNYGCLESFISFGAIMDAICDEKKRRHEPAPLTLIEAAVAARRGDRVASHVFNSAGAALARGIAILLNLVNPERIILASHLVEVRTLLREIVDEYLPHYVFSSAALDCTIVGRDLPTDLGARGAAAVAITRFLNLPPPPWHE